MSKGPGRQQKRILAALDKCPAFYVAELCESGTRAEHVSLLRAAQHLYDAEQVDIMRYIAGGTQQAYVVVMRRGYRLLERPKRGNLAISSLNGGGCE
jgi:hypothetical protein